MTSSICDAWFDLYGSGSGDDIAGGGDVDVGGGTDAVDDHAIVPDVPAPLHPPVAPEPPGPPIGPGVADVTVFLVGIGRISYYAYGNRFEASCDSSIHTICRLTRTSRADRRDRNEAQGRPMGLLAAWLLANGLFTTKMDHRETAVIMSFSHEERMDARAYITALPNGPLLLSYERMQRVGEGIEPLGLP